eukprot:CAMPEP_0194076594 /NCGR_PEP_ID=MMETSP0149-20130528/3377_1 /TAXON_ID=122233 /ORGANISM="Chaetoceros debilis, Strain MM31A-1" /LENGTH=399 /DNA_ID=CAMNT_0038757385 /DNA_START=197 /DNA_END=1392 /DNA_ORIENTATION=+
MAMAKEGKRDNVGEGESENGAGGELTPLSDLQDILNEFPINDISHAFGYGSGVFEQKVVNSDSGDDSKSRKFKSEEKENGSDGADDQNQQQQDQQQQQQQPMIDLILSTSNAKQWHDENLKMNPSHYALLPRMFGASFISQVQDVGAGVYFNPMAVVKTTTSTGADTGSSTSSGTESLRLVKYGIIEDEILKSDLQNWDCMYIAGRMHKPIATFNQPYQDDEILYLQEEYNLKYAIATALLLTSGNDLKDGDGDGDDNNTTTRIVDVGRVFEAIAGLSYIGDPRLAAGAEDPLKVKKLVHSQGQWDRFYSVYETQFQKLERKGLLTLSSSQSQLRMRPTNMGSHSAGESVISESESESAYSCALEIDLYDRSTRRELYQQLPPRLQQDSSISSLLVTST